MRSFLQPKFLVPIIISVFIVILSILFFTGVNDPDNAVEPTTPSKEVVFQTVPTEPKPSETIEDDWFEPEGEKEIEEPTAPEADHVHEYGETVILPSCTRNGYTVFECSCGDSYKDNVKAKTDHQYSSKVVSPTSTSKGYTLYTCSVCEKEYKDNYTDPIEKPTEAPKETKPKETKPKETKPKETKPKETTPKPAEKPNETGSNSDESPNEDYGKCPKCGLGLWTSTNPHGCFTFLTDTKCDCGEYVLAMECHHH